MKLFRYVPGGPSIQAEDWNAAVDAIERLERQQAQPTGIVGGIAAGVAVAGSTAIVSRRNLLTMRWLAPRND